MFWQTLNIFAYILAIIGGILILVSGIVKFKQYGLNGFFAMGIGLGLVGISFSFDLFSRFLGPGAGKVVFICLRISILFFYPGSLIALFSFFIVQPRVPWIRMIIYTLFFGMMIEMHLGSDYYVVYYPEFDMWFTYFTDIRWMQILNFLTSLPFADLMIYVIRRHRLGFISKPARMAVFLFWMGLIPPFIFMFIPIPDEYVNISISNLVFVIGLLFYSFAFIKEPLVFTLSTTKYYEIIIASPNEGDIAIGQYAWMRNNMQDLKSQALSAINSLLNEMVRENMDDLNLIQLIDLGKKKVVIEHSAHFIGYMVASAVDPTINYGLKMILSEIEKKSQKNERLKNTILNSNEFKFLIQKSFTFATAANKIQ